MCIWGQLSGLPTMYISNPPSCPTSIAPPGTSLGTCDSSVSLAGNGGTCLLSKPSGYHRLSGSLRVTCTYGVLSELPTMASGADPGSGPGTPPPCAPPTPPLGTTAGTCNVTLAGTGQSCTLVRLPGYDIVS